MEDPTEAPSPFGSDGSRHLDEALLREVSHDFGNQFHRVYYLIEQLRGALTDDAPSLVASAEDLESLVTKLETVTKGTLAYFSPVEARVIPLTVADVVESVRQRLWSRSLDVEGLAEHAELAVLADPGLLSGALATISTQVEGTLAEGAPLGMRVSVGKLEPGKVELALVHGSVDAGPPNRLERALAERYLAAQGGALVDRAIESDCAEGASRASVVLLSVHE